MRRIICGILKSSLAVWILVFTVSRGGDVRLFSSRAVNIAAPAMSEGGPGERLEITARDAEHRVLSSQTAAVDRSVRVEVQPPGADAIVSSVAEAEEGTVAVVVPAGAATIDVHHRPTARQATFRLPDLEAQAARPITPAAIHDIFVSGDSANRVDLLILGDGYRAAEEAKFYSDAAGLAERFFSITPYAEYREYFNVRALFVASVQSGADHPNCPTDVGVDPKRGQFADTAFDATYCGNGVIRGVTVNTAKVLTQAAAAPETDRVAVIVNDDEYGGSGGFVWVTSTHPQSVEIAHHENGHSFAGLTDEYTSPFPGYPRCSDLGGPACEPNATDETQRSLVKWTRWIETDTPVPTSPNVADRPGLFLGCRYSATAYYRPKSDCLMNHLRTTAGTAVPFCEICREAFVMALYRGWATPFGGRTTGIRLIEPASERPAGSAITATKGETIPFHAATLQPNGLPVSLRWSVNGAVQPVTGNDFAFTPAATGAYTIALEVSDTSFVRDPLGLAAARTEQTWQLTVQDPVPRRRAIAH
jgi:hypothetical protein